MRAAPDAFSDDEEGREITQHHECCGCVVQALVGCPRNEAESGAHGPPSERAHSARISTATMNGSMIHQMALCQSRCRRVIAFPCAVGCGGRGASDTAGPSCIKFARCPKTQNNSGSRKIVWART